MANHTITAARATHKFLSSLSPKPKSPIKIGLTPMVGVNDISVEVFSLADAQKVLNFANGEGKDYVAFLGFWSLNRDANDCKGGDGEVDLEVSTGIVQGKWGFSLVLGVFGQ